MQELGCGNTFWPTRLVSKSFEYGKNVAIGVWFLAEFMTICTLIIVSKRKPWEVAWMGKFRVFKNKRI